MILITRMTETASSPLAALHVNSIVNILSTMQKHNIFVAANSIRPIAISITSSLISHFSLEHPDYVHRQELFLWLVESSSCRNKFPNTTKFYYTFMNNLIWGKHQKHHDDKVFAYAIEKYTRLSAAKMDCFSLQSNEYADRHSNGKWPDCQPFRSRINRFSSKNCPTNDVQYVGLKYFVERNSLLKL